MGEPRGRHHAWHHADVQASCVGGVTAPLRNAAAQPTPPPLRTTHVTEPARRIVIGIRGERVFRRSAGDSSTSTAGLWPQYPASTNTLSPVANREGSDRDVFAMLMALARAPCGVRLLSRTPRSSGHPCAFPCNNESFCKNPTVTTSFQHACHCYAAAFNPTDTRDKPRNIASTAGIQRLAKGRRRRAAKSVTETCRTIVKHTILEEPQTPAACALRQTSWRFGVSCLAFSCQALGRSRAVFACLERLWARGLHWR
jgi:hypothetical protein